MMVSALLLMLASTVSVTASLVAAVDAEVYEEMSLLQGLAAADAKLEGILLMVTADANLEETGHEVHASDLQPEVSVLFAVPTVPAVSMMRPGFGSGGHASVAVLAVAAGAAVLMLVALVLLWFGDGLPAERTKLQVSILASQLVSRAGYAALIPESYNLARHLGFSAAASGAFIGSNMALCGITTICMKMLMLRWSHLHLKTLLITCNGAILLCFLGTAVVASPPAWFPELASGQRFAVLLALRSAIGVLRGPSAFHEAITVAATPNSQMFRYQMWKVCAVTGGVGLGPLLSALAVCASGAGSIEDRTAATSYVFVVPWASVIALSIFWLPSDISPLTSAKALDDSTEVVGAIASGNIAHDTQSGQPSPQVRSHVWVKAVLFGLQRTFIISALEAATAYLLQVEFGWDVSMISCTIGVIFLLTTPLTLVADQVRKRGLCTDERLACYSACICACSATLLLPQLNMVFEMNKNTSVALLLVADLMMFGCGYLASAVSDSIAIRMSMQDTVFSSSNFILVNRVLRSAMRFAGPVCARALLAAYGRAGYAKCQLFISALACVTCYSAARNIDQKF